MHTIFNYLWRVQLNTAIHSFRLWLENLIPFLSKPQSADSVASFKRMLSSNTIIVPKHFLFGERKSQVLLARLRKKLQFPFSRPLLKKHSRFT